VGEQEVFDLVCEGEDTHSFIGNLMITHNCLLWIDEIEKSLSGTKSSNVSDGGTLARVFGTLLTAMEERMKGVVVIATANDIQALPPELIRRFTEVFFVDLPTPEEREEIFKIHLKKRKRESEKIDLTELITASHQFTGSEIEKAVKEGIVRAYHDGKRELKAVDILGALQDTRAISRVMKEKIDEIRDWARNRARYASSLAAAASQPGAQKITSKKGRKISISDAADEDIVIKKKKEENQSPLDNRISNILES
jgi:SpoVK/Ycf46/Vps4 family AAA+-type ATPase